MDIIKQIGIFFGICLLSDLLAGALPVAVPASMIGMVLLFLLLYFQILKPDHIEKKSDFLLGNMAFFFIPAGVGIVENLRFIQGSVLPLLLICLITTVLTFGAAALTVRWAMRLQEKYRRRRDPKE